MRKMISVLSAAALLMTSLVFSAGAAAAPSHALIAAQDITIGGSSKVEGDALVTSGVINSGKYKSITGTTYITEKVSNKNTHLAIAAYTGTVEDYRIADYKDAPGADFFTGSVFSDGTKELTVGWGGSDYSDNTNIVENVYAKKITVNPTVNLNIVANENQTIVIRTDELVVKGNLNISGNGSVVIYTDQLQGSAAGTINKNGSSESLAIVFGNGQKSITIDNFSALNGNIIAPGASVKANNLTMTGNIYAGGEKFDFTNSGEIQGLVYVPNALTAMGGSTRITGQVITSELYMSGNTRIVGGPYGGLGNLEDTLINGSDSGSGGGGNTDSEQPGEGEVTITAVVPKKMSIRLENGAIVKNGETFVMPENGTIRFQMCTNNWDTDTYSDGGQGFAGTKVYSFTHDSKRHDNTLRVDTNTYFMAVRYHFTKGDYNKQTGIDNVLSTPLESLSVNLPLGSTVESKAYINYQQVETANVFVETAADKTISYTDYSWSR